MVFVQVCVGSSCHLKGSETVVELMKKSIEQYSLSDDIVLSGSFCIGKCNRSGVTIQVDDDIFTGINAENFKDFFEKNILRAVKDQDER